MTEAYIFDAIRTPRGRDIDAACGQLKTAAERKSRAELDRQAEEKLADLQAKKEAAASAGDTAKAKKLDKEIESAQSMLEMIRRSAASL